MPTSEPNTDPAEHPRPMPIEAVRRVALAAASGLLAGAASWAFLEALDAVTEIREDHRLLILFLPLAGLAVGAAYHLFGRRAAQGNALLLQEIHEPAAWVPRRMAPMVAVGTVASHLFGASVGREGTALQMSGSLTDLMARTLRLGHRDRRWLLVAALAGGFGGVFGVPWAGAVFAVEVQSLRRGGLARIGRRLRRGAPATADPTHPVTHRVREIAVLAGPALVASFVADRLVRVLGHDHSGPPTLHPAIDAALVGRCVLVGVILAIAAIAFVDLTEAVRAVARRIRWAPARPLVGGLVVVALLATFGTRFAGLSLGLIDDAFSGRHGWGLPVVKILVTALCLGAGFVGGEVTPLFVIGATTGAASASLVGLDPVVGAAVGFVGTFAGAANTPVACTVMGIELFGPGLTVPLVVACATSYACSGSRTIYATQRIAGRREAERGTTR